MNKKFIVIGFFAFTLLVSFSRTEKKSLNPSKAIAVTAVPLYRLVDPYGYHFYTTNEVEKNATVKDLGYKDEGVLGYVFPQQVPGTIPLFRYRGEFYYYTNIEKKLAITTARHFYTTQQNDKELKIIIQSPKYNYQDNGAGASSYSSPDFKSYESEGIQCYVPTNIQGVVPIYWLSNSQCFTVGEGDHNKMAPGSYDNLYTNDEEEKFSVIYKYQYKDRGIAFYVWKTTVTSK